MSVIVVDGRGTGTGTASHGKDRGSSNGPPSVPGAKSEGMASSDRVLMDDGGERSF